MTRALIPILFIVLWLWPTHSASAAPCGGPGQRACCIGERAGPACNPGTREEAGCSGDCRCARSIFSAGSHCSAVEPCGGPGQRACCAGEAAQACRPGAQEVAGCSGNCRCGNNLLNSNGTCVKVKPCGAEGQRACCAGERSGSSCNAGTYERPRCEGDCRCGNNLLSSSGTCIAYTPCGGENQRACCIGERPRPCGPGLKEEPGAPPNSRCSNNLLSSSSHCRKLEPRWGPFARAECRFVNQREWTAVLIDGDDSVCAKMPADISGVHFERPASCANGQGTFLMPDASCQASFPPLSSGGLCEAGKRWFRANLSAPRGEDPIAVCKQTKATKDGQEFLPTRCVCYGGLCSPGATVFKGYVAGEFLIPDPTCPRPSPDGGAGGAGGSGNVDPACKDGSAIDYYEYCVLSAPPGVVEKRSTVILGCKDATEAVVGQQYPGYSVTAGECQPKCGDYNRDFGEACDEGPSGGDDCSSNCTRPAGGGEAAHTPEVRRAAVVPANSALSFRDGRLTLSGASTADLAWDGKTLSTTGTLYRMQDIAAARAQREPNQRAGAIQSVEPRAGEAYLLKLKQPATDKAFISLRVSKLDAKRQAVVLDWLNPSEPIAPKKTAPADKPSTGGCSYSLPGGGRAASFSWLILGALGLLVHQRRASRRGRSVKLHPSRSRWRARVLSAARGLAIGLVLTLSAAPASADEFGVWSVNMGSAGYKEGGTPDAVADFSKRFASLLTVFEAQRARGWRADLIALQEISAHDHPAYTWLDCEGVRLSAADCMANALSKATQQRYRGKQVAWLGYVYNASVFQAVGAPFLVENTRPGYEDLMNGKFLGTLLRHRSTGITFPFISVHLAVTGGAAGVYHDRALALIEKFVRSIHQNGYGIAVVAGDYNYPYARTPSQHNPFSVQPPPEADRDAIDLVLFGPRQIERTHPSLRLAPALSNGVAYFFNLDVGTPNGNDCKGWAQTLFARGESFSDHCALAARWSIQARPSPKCPPGTRWCECTESCAAANWCAKQKDLGNCGRRD